MISIITPSFRQPDWLRLCASSVADQEGVQYEHIVQEGSDDPRVESSVSQFPKLRFYREPDEGMYDAVNRGLAKAKGDICAYLNCDEQYLPGALARVTEFFENHPRIDVVFGDVVLVNERGDPISYRRSILPRVRHIRASHLNTLSCGMFFRRRLVEAGFVFEPQWKDVGDAVWVESLLRRGIKMDVIQDPLAVFTFTGQNRSADIVARLERSRRAGTSRITRLFKYALVAEHRLRKAFAGAYKGRDLEISVYTSECPTVRGTRRAAKYVYTWPI